MAILPRVFPLNVPNVLTLLRILAVPVVVVALLDETPNGDVLAAIVFALAALTDGLDGYIARRRQQVTTFGKLMDPLADKLLIVAALVSLVSLDRLAAWVAMVIIAREFAVTGLRAVAAERGVVISASWLGKVKTVLQVAAIFALILLDPAPIWVDVLRLRRGRGHGDLRRSTTSSGCGRRFERAEASSGPRSRGSRLARRSGSSSHSRLVRWWRLCSPVASSARISSIVPTRSATTLWRWIVSRFSWRAERKASSASSG